MYRAQGIDVAGLAGGLAAALTGGDVYVGADAGGNAAANNAFWLPVVVIAYLLYQGEGNPIEGLRTMARGEDLVSVLIAAGATEAISFSIESLS